MGTYSVEEGSLRQLVGIPASGDWRLRITDGMQTSGTGQLENWSIKLLPTPPPVRFETWSLLTRETDTLVYALTEPTAFLTGKISLEMLRCHIGAGAVRKTSFTATRSQMTCWTGERLKTYGSIRQRTSDPVEDVHIIWQPIGQQQFLRLRTD
ncbi:MAG: hypothetical protein GWQ08_11210 [Verrucomicrobiaceae bacterium]|nr:hypothetical protein [Verrucomicrobiaceae bacterium]